MKNLHLDAGKFRSLVTIFVDAAIPDDSGGTTENWQISQQAWARIFPSRAEALPIADQMRGIKSQLIDFRQPLEIAAGARVVDGNRTFDVIAVWDPDETGRYWRCQCQEVLN